MVNVLKGKLGASIVLGIILLITLSFPLAFADKSVSLPRGTDVPGCEESNQCFIPYSVTITTGERVTWSNDDTSAHTVTSGTAVDGPDGVFDSSLFMAGNTFSHTFDSPGTFDYFCMVHPWMVGTIKVQAAPLPTQNQNPVLKYTISPSTMYAGESIQFDARNSYDPDGSIVKYEWYFGDGDSSFNSNTFHTFDQPVVGTTGMVKITDDDRAVTSENFVIRILSPTPEPREEPEPTCEPGTVLKNGVCVTEGQGNGVSTMVRYRAAVRSPAVSYAATTSGLVQV